MIQSVSLVNVRMRYLPLVAIFFFPFLVVNAGETRNLTLIYNGHQGLSSVVNGTSKIGMIVDYINNLQMYLNGQTGVSILLDYSTNSAYRLTDSWKASEEPFKQFFLGLKSLQPFLETAKQTGTASTITNPTEAIRDEIVRHIIDLSGSFNISNFNILGQELIYQLKGPLWPMYKEQGEFKVLQNLINFVKMNYALGVWLDKADDVSLIGPMNLSYIFSDKTGLGTYLNFMEQIGDQADFSKVFGTILKDQNNFLRMIEDVEKTVSYDGMDGYDIVLADIMLLLRGNGTLRDVIDSLLKYDPKGEANFPTLVRYRDQFVDILKKQLKTYQNYDSVGWVHDLALSKVNKSLVILNVNITDVMNALFFTNFRDTFFYTVRALSGLLVPQNVPHIIQWIIDDVDVHNFFVTLFPSHRDHKVTADDVFDFLSEIPIVDKMFPLVIEFVSGVMRTLNHSIHKDFEVVWDDVVNRSFGTVTTDFLWGLLTDVLHFVTKVFNAFGLYLGDPHNGGLFHM